MKPGELDFNLNTPEIQEGVLTAVKELSVDLVVFDNLSKLARGFDKNAAEQWEPFLAFCDRLRASGSAILIVHHAGKSGDQLGSKTQEIGLDTNIKLIGLEGGVNGFKINFKKLRNRPPSPATLEVKIIDKKPGPSLEWSKASAGPSKYSCEILGYIAEGGSNQAHLATNLDLSGPPSVTSHLNQLKEAGLLEQGKGITELTSKGKAFLAENQ